MTLRANWHVESLLADAADDPLEARVEDVGKPVDLDADEPRLVKRLTELLRAEGNLYELGVTCPIKDRSDTSCSACPKAAPFSGTRRGRLCAVGREQEQVLTTLAAMRVDAEPS